LRRVNLRLEFKLLITITLILAVGFAVVNFISVKAYRAQFMQRIKSEASLYQVLLLYSDEIALPPYLKLSEKPPDDPSKWKVLGKVKGKRILLDLERVDRRVLKYGFSLFLWELPVWILTILVVYRAVSFFVRREKEAKEFIKLFFLLFTHKLGNFLSLDRVNLELLQELCGDRKPLRRLRRSYQILEDDFKKSLRYIEAFDAEREPEAVDLSGVLKEVVSKYGNYFPEKQVVLKTFPLKVKARRVDLENLLHLLIENAFKYSKSFVEVSLEKRGRGYLLSIVNDPGDASSGSGMGLKMAEFLAKRLGWELRLTPEKSRFVAELLIP